MVRVPIIATTLLIASLTITFIAFFARDRFLFFLHSYDVSLLNSTKVEAFEAYKNIYKSKLVLILLGLFLCATSTFITNRYYIIYKQSYLRLFFISN